MTNPTFTYENMTPHLEAYLGRRPCPHYVYANGRVTAESEAARKAWDAEVEALIAQCLPGEISRYNQAKKEWLCRDETCYGEPRVRVSGSGKYRLVVTNHKTTGWDYSKGRIYRGEDLIVEVCRNYGSFPFTWVEGHPKGDFLVCGEDYQGQTVIDLLTGQKVSYRPKQAQQGGGFCWAVIKPSPDKLLLAVEGCYWGCPYEVRIVDFSDPINFPWAEIRSPFDTLVSWDGPTSCTVGFQQEVVDLPGHPLDGKAESQMTMTEMKIVQEEADKLGDSSDDLGWKKVMCTRKWDFGAESFHK